MEHQKLVSETEISDNDLVKEELTELASKQKDVEKIILRIATKLADSGKYEILTEISSRVQKLLPDYSPSYIRLVLPEKYKRPYTKQDEDEPQNEYEESWRLITDLFKEMASYMEAGWKKIKKDPNFYNAWVKSVHEFINVDVPKQFASIGDFVRHIKELYVEYEIMKKETDYRIKLTEFHKVRLKIEIMIYSQRKVAKDVSCTPKWVSEGIEDNPELLNRLRRIESCPCGCGFNLYEYYITNQTRLDEGLDIIPFEKWGVYQAKFNPK